MDRALVNILKNGKVYAKAQIWAVFSLGLQNV